MIGFSATASMASADSYSSFVPSHCDQKSFMLQMVASNTCDALNAAIRIQNLQSLNSCAPHNR
jgi:hypothetical protein